MATQCAISFGPSRRCILSCDYTALDCEWSSQNHYHANTSRNLEYHHLTSQGAPQLYSSPECSEDIDRRAIVCPSRTSSTRADAHLGHASLEERSMVASTRLLLRLHRVGMRVCGSTGIHELVTDGGIIRRGLRDSERRAFRVCPVTFNQQIESSTFYSRAPRVMGCASGCSEGQNKKTRAVSNVPPTEFFVLSTASANFCLAFSVPDGMMIG